MNSSSSLVPAAELSQKNEIVTFLKMTGKAQTEQGRKVGLAFIDPSLTFHEKYMH